MSRPKSFISGRVAWERAIHSHNCTRDKKHRIIAGALRLTIPEGRSAVTYCVECGKKMIEADTRKLNALLQQLKDLQAES